MSRIEFNSQLSRHGYRPFAIAGAPSLPAGKTGEARPLGDTRTHRLAGTVEAPR
jgi:hypothetical protein